MFYGEDETLASYVDDNDVHHTGRLGKIQGEEGFLDALTQGRVTIVMGIRADDLSDVDYNEADSFCVMGIACDADGRHWDHWATSDDFDTLEAAQAEMIATARSEWCNLCTIADLLGVDRATAATMYDEDKLPPTDRDGAPWWRKSTIENWRPARRYLDQAGIADRLGLKAQSVRDLRERGRLPNPDALIGNRPGWLPETIDRWQADRKRPTAP